MFHKKCVRWNFSPDAMKLIFLAASRVSFLFALLLVFQLSLQITHATELAQNTPVDDRNNKNTTSNNTLLAPAQRDIKNNQNNSAKQSSSIRTRGVPAGFENLAPARNTSSRNKPNSVTTKNNKKSSNIRTKGVPAGFEDLAPANSKTSPQIEQPNDANKNNSSIRTKGIPAGFENLVPKTPQQDDTPKVYRKGTFTMKGVPKGFEDADMGETTSVDVFYGNVFLLSTLASYTNNYIEFEQAEAVSRSLPNLISPDIILEDLRGKIDTNSDKVCQSNNQFQECGNLNPETVAIIFDEGRFRADVFINPNLLSVQALDFNKYLPPASTKLATLHNMSAFLANSDTSQQFSFNLNQFVSYQDYLLNLLWSFNGASNGGSNVDIENLAFEKNTQKHQYKAGMFDSDARFFTFAPNFEILGLHFSNSLKARTDLNFATGTPIELYLPSRSQVKIFKGKRFLGAGFYNPGNQTIDTSNLPPGNYDITLQIIDAAGRETEETRFFVKSPSLAPMDQDLYFIELGNILRGNSDKALPESTGQAALLAGYSKRLLHNFGMNFGLIANDQESVSEIGIFYLSKIVELEPRFIFTDQGNHGISLRGYGRHGKWTESYEFRKMTLNNPVENDVGSIQFGPSRSYTNHTFSLSYPLFNGQAQFRFNSNQNEEAEKETRYTLSYLKPLPWKTPIGRFNVRADFIKDDEESIFQVGINLLNRQKNGIFHQASTKYRSAGEDDEARTEFSYRGSWNDREWRPEDINISWNALQATDQTALGFNINASNAYGAGRFSFATQNNDESSNTKYSAQLHSSLASEKGVWGFGGKNGAQSAIIVSLQSGSKIDTSFDVMINDSRYASITGGQHIVVPVPAYQTYTVELKDRGTSFIDFGEARKTITLYPGNVKDLIWQARRIIVFTANIVQRSNKCENKKASCLVPLKNALVENIEGFASTDDAGFIQTEIYSDLQYLELKSKSGICRVDLSELDLSEQIVYLEEDIECFKQAAKPIKLDDFGNAIKNSENTKNNKANTDDKPTNNSSKNPDQKQKTESKQETSQNASSQNTDTTIDNAKNTDIQNKDNKSSKTKGWKGFLKIF